MSRMGYVRLVLELFHFSNELKLKNISQLRESISKSIIVGVCVWLGVCMVKMFANAFNTAKYLMHYFSCSCSCCFSCSCSRTRS